MAPNPQQTPPPPPPPAGGAPPSTAGPDLEGRVNGLEAEQRRQGGLLEQILDRLPGRGHGGGRGPDPAPAADGRSVADLVREGIERLEADKSAKAEADANKTAREDHAARLRALEERAPAETAATPVGAFRASVQRYGFGIDTPGR